jgi:cytochrome c
MRQLIVPGLSGAAAVVTMANAVLAADAARGQQVFAACAACHSEHAGGIGPPLKGVVGRKSAAVESYRYSGPMRRANLIWDESNLREFISDPQDKVPGNRMPFGGLREQRDIDDVIAYLKSQN